MNIRLTALTLVAIVFLSCNKAPAPAYPAPLFEIFVNNEFNELHARFAVFISDQSSGETLAFRYIPNEDSIVLQVPNSRPEDRYDCTVLKITTLTIPGTGIRDTTLFLSTYTNLASGEQINLRNQVYQQGTYLTFKLTGMNSLDSVVVPDAYAVTSPQSSNNFDGNYYCYHSGRCWIRVLVDGDPFWRFARFDNVDGPDLEANTLDTDIFLSILAPPLKLKFPFVSDWYYKVDGVVDSANLEFFPLSPQLLAPGSFIPIIDAVDIFEPVNNELFDPNRPYTFLRVQTKGAEPSAGGYTYISDHFYSVLPAVLPVPDFDVAPTVLADNRLIAVNCIGDFDLLAFSRSRIIPGMHFKITWEVITKPTNGIVSYRLPDVPPPLDGLYPSLKSYDFNVGVKARAESYEQGIPYESIVRQHLGANDVLWQAKAGYLGKERSF